jgi:hypothetical protein
VSNLNEHLQRGVDSRDTLPTHSEIDIQIMLIYHFLFYGVTAAKSMLLHDFQESPISSRSAAIDMKDVISGFFYMNIIAGITSSYN